MYENVAVVGYGYVGKAVADFFKDNFEVFAYDPLYVKDEGYDKDGIHFVSDSDRENQINSCDLAVICVPTPKNEDGSVDLSYILDVLSWVSTPYILIKSTIPPGTTQSLVAKTGKRIVFSPEYIGEGKYVIQWWKDQGHPHPTDMKKHDFQIFGGIREHTTEVLEFFKKVLGPSAKYIQTDSTTAELTKYMENSWGATKVIFSNEFAKIAEAFGVDYNELRELFLMDGRVERMHTAVFKDKPGFGGKCFPKDVSGIVDESRKAGYNPILLSAVLESNKELRKGYDID